MCEKTLFNFIFLDSDFWHELGLILSSDFRHNKFRKKCFFVGNMFSNLDGAKAKFLGRNVKDLKPSILCTFIQEEMTQALGLFTDVYGI